jgi:hypothetical protein
MNSFIPASRLTQYHLSSIFASQTHKFVSRHRFAACALSNFTRHENPELGGDTHDTHAHTHAHTHTRKNNRTNEPTNLFLASLPRRACSVSRWPRKLDSVSYLGSTAVMELGTLPMTLDSYRINPNSCTRPGNSFALGFDTSVVVVFSLFYYHRRHHGSTECHVIMSLIKYDRQPHTDRQSVS